MKPTGLNRAWKHLGWPDPEMLPAPPGAGIRFGVRRQSGAVELNPSDGGHRLRLPRTWGVGSPIRRDDGAFPWPQCLC